MTIADTREKCKNLIARVPRDGFIVSVLIFSCLLSFGFGYLAGKDAGSVPTSTSMSEIEAPTESVGVVASKNGTKYYLPSCSGADRIADANKVWFASPAAATAAGYSPAANCPGL